MKEEFKKAEEPLKGYEGSLKALVTKYKLLSDASLDAIIIHDNGHIRYMNRAALRLFGYERMELRRIHLEKLFVPGARDLIYEAIESNEQSCFEAIAFRKGGTAFPVEATFEVFSEPNNMHIRAAVFRDISKRKDIEKQLMRSEREYRKLFEEAKDAIYITGKDGAILDANMALLELFKYQKEELLKLNVIHLYMNPSDRERFIRTVESEKSVRDFEVTLKDREGTPINCLVTSSVRYDQTGNITGYQGIIRDITNVKKTEELERAKKLAERSAQLKSRFLANMSHEIRTPLNAVFGITNLLSDTPLNEQQKHYIDLIQTSTDHLLVLINDILDFSKIEAGKLDVESEEFNLYDLLQNLADTVEFRLKEKDLQFVLDMDELLPEFVVGDSVRINQVLLNLLSNAIKFTDEGEIRLKVKLLESKERFASIQFSVQDTGIGISRENQEKIFDLFTQGGDQITRLYGGTGLGLAISRRLVEMMGGKLVLKSKEHEGSTFSFSLQLKTGSGENLRREQREEKEFVFRDLGALRILLVEDNKVNQYVMAETIRRWGPNIYIEVADNGLKAFQSVKEKVFDLVIMDVQMPVMNGHEATRRIREALPEAKRSVPILAMTAFATAGEAEKCLSSGMDDYIPKPFNPKNLYTKIARLTGAKPGRALDPGMSRKTREDKKRPGSQSAKKYDLSYLSSITQGDEDLKLKMLQTILDEAPEELSRMKALYIGKDWPKLRGAAHKFKSTLIFLGNKKLEAIVKKIEQNAMNENELAKTGDMINFVTENCQLLLEQIRADMNL